MDQKKEDQDQSFKVTDRRKFTLEGELRQPEPGEDPVEAPSLEAPQRAPEPPPSAQARKEPPPQERFETDFSSFLLSIATTALVHLGEIPDPESNRRHENLALARQMIDTLGMLQQKTQGNLSLEEANLVENLLYELRMKFVSKSGVARY